jgi:hypothetical protein
MDCVRFVVSDPFDEAPPFDAVTMDICSSCRLFNKISSNDNIDTNTLNNIVLTNSITND